MSHSAIAQPFFAPCFPVCATSFAIALLRRMLRVFFFFGRPHMQNNARRVVAFHSIFSQKIFHKDAFEFPQRRLTGCTSCPRDCVCVHDSVRVAKSKRAAVIAPSLRRRSNRKSSWPTTPAWRGKTAVVLLYNRNLNVNGACWYRHSRHFVGNQIGGGLNDYPCHWKPVASRKAAALLYL